MDGVFGDGGAGGGEGHYRGREQGRRAVGGWAVARPEDEGGRRGADDEPGEDGAGGVEPAGPVWSRCWREDGLGIELTRPLEGFLGYIATW